jgi:hypothetical protein
VNDLGLVETVDRFGEGIVVEIADAANRRLDARSGQTLGVSDADVLSIAELTTRPSADRPKNKIATSSAAC